MHKIAVIGLGYVGFPLAKLFASKYQVVGFDIDQFRVLKLKLEESSKSIDDSCHSASNRLLLTHDLEDLVDCNIYIITVPTPINQHNTPDLRPLYRASKSIARVLKKDDIVIYESTVYPGATEEDCLPILEKISGLQCNVDFYIGYSPERINPGDQEYTVEKIKKVTSGSTPEAAKIINDLYASVIVAGTYMAPSIKVAEASKVIENAQRDINIAFINEVKKILDALDVDTEQVLAAAATKWNFVNVKPGLVGGHCISVDPYYLLQRAQRAGYNSELISLARSVNDGMSNYIVDQVLQQLADKRIAWNNASVLILGFTFKPDSSDIRNTKVNDIISIFESYKVSPTVYDPYADPILVRKEYNIDLHNQLFYCQQYDAVVIAVNHSAFENIALASLLTPSGFVYSLEKRDVNLHSQQERTLRHA